MSKNETLTIRKLPFYFFLVLLGFLLAYILVVLKEKTKDVIPVTSSAQIIKNEEAGRYTSNYAADQEQLPSLYRLYAVKDTSETLKGFWITKGMLQKLDETILKNNPDAKIVGYSLYLGKADRRENKRAYNLVIRGSMVPTDNVTFRFMYKPGYVDSKDAIEMIDPKLNYDLIQ